MEARRARRRVGGARRRKTAGSVRGVGGVDEMRAGGEGGRERRTRVDLGLLVHASKNERMKVTSALQVPGPNRSWDPASATPAAH